MNLSRRALGCAVAAGLAWGSMTLGAQEKPENPALSELNSAITFYASFDHDSPSADLANGKADPSSVEGKAAFLPGKFGKALLLGSNGGGATVRYPAQDNVDFNQSGAVSFWIAPESWIAEGEKPDRELVVFLLINGAQGGNMLIERQGFAKGRKDIFLGGYFNIPDLKTAILMFDGTLNWKKGQWHLAVMNWDAKGFSLSLDGSPLKHQDFSRKLSGHDFPEGEKAAVRIGGANQETTLIDELTFYNRPLTDQEIHALMK